VKNSFARKCDFFSFSTETERQTAANKQFSHNASNSQHHFSSQKQKINQFSKKKKKKIKCPTRSLRLDFHPEPLPRGLEQASSISGRGQIFDSDAIVIPGGERTFVEDAGRSLAASVVGVEGSSDEDRRLDSIS
jgi:hypothetical protein